MTGAMQDDGSVRPAPDRTGIVRVLVADDHPLFRDALARSIAQSPQLEVVGEAADAPEATEQIERLLPDVAVLDLRMPGDGREVLAAVTRLELATRVLFLSEYVDTTSVLSAVSAGASGYLAKGAEGDAIRQAVIEVARGGTALSNEAQRALLSGVRSREQVALSSLTPRELEMLALLANGLTNAKIAARLYVSPETVKAHLRNLFGKLGVSDRTAAVAEALRRGLIE
ncbi:MAG: two-component system, NarL family, nitrate/nitrite response regulator NarL [Gaiellaceae bacterium]|nr:two-component system, NarL family, nitrate/nitrite response regulator NarL [Gaiellaceae bacterium]